MKIKYSISREIVTLIVVVLAAMFMVSLIMLKLIEFSYQKYVYESKTDTLNGSIRGVEAELEKIEDSTYQLLTDSVIQRSISQWLEAENWLETEFRNESSGSQGDVMQKQREKQKQKTDSMREVIQQIDPVITADRSIVAGFFITPDGRRYNGYGSGMLQLSSTFQEEIVQEAAEKPGDPVCLVCCRNGNRLIKGKSIGENEKTNGEEIEDEENSQIRNQLLVARTVRERKNFSMTHGGTLILVVDPEFLTEAYTSASQRLLIVDDSQGIVFSPLEHREEQAFLAEQQNAGEEKCRYQILSLGEETYFVTQILSEKRPWKYYSISSYEALFGLLDKADMMYMLIFGAMTVLICMIAVRFSVNLVRPIVQLSETISSIRGGNGIAQNLRLALPDQVRQKSREDEIGELQRQFFDMVRELDQLIHENYQQKIYLQQAQLSALRTQLNPHFLYNTLDLIRWLSTSRRSGQIPAVVRALGDILRASMNSRNNKIVIGEEVAYLRSYLSIQKIRFGERLHLELKIPEDLMEYLIPAFSLQPLVENAVNYAMEQMIEPCFITVLIEDRGERLACTVTDNGPGIEDGILEKLREGRRKARGNGIGLRNLDDRLKSLYGETYGVQIGNDPQGGARISFCVRKEVEVKNDENSSGDYCG